MEDKYMNIVVVEDSVIIQMQLVTMLSAIKGVRIAGLAGTENDAVNLIKSAKPDLILMDISLERGTGLNVLRTIRNSGNTSKVLMLTNHTESRFRQLSLTLGANGYFDKTKELDQVLVLIKKWQLEASAKEDEEASEVF
jgi:DNA-binding NarL/FixJ family response regulator